MNGRKFFDFSSTQNTTFNRGEIDVGLNLTSYPAFAKMEKTKSPEGQVSLIEKFLSTNSSNVNKFDRRR